MGKIYSSADDCIGMTKAIVLFYRVFGKEFPWSRPGTYQVVICAPGGPGFSFPLVFGVMDDFGNLVTVEG